MSTSARDRSLRRALGKLLSHSAVLAFIIIPVLGSNESMGEHDTTGEVGHTAQVRHQRTTEALILETLESEGALPEHGAQG